MIQNNTEWLLWTHDVQSERVVNRSRFPLVYPADGFAFGRSWPSETKTIKPCYFRHNSNTYTYYDIVGTTPVTDVARAEVHARNIDENELKCLSGKRDRHAFWQAWRHLSFQMDVGLYGGFRRKAKSSVTLGEWRLVRTKWRLCAICCTIRQQLCHWLPEPSPVQWRMRPRVGQDPNAQSARSSHRSQAYCRWSPRTRLPTWLTSLQHISI